METLRARTAAQQNIKRKDILPLNLGDTVHMQRIQPHEDVWSKGVVMEKQGRDYMVASEGRSYRRNRQLLRGGTSTRAPDTPLSGGQGGKILL